MADTEQPSVGTVEPKKKPRKQPKPAPKVGPPRQLPPYNVVLLNDDDHTYDYVIEMLKAVFAHPAERGMQLAQEVDARGRAIVLTTHKERAELEAGPGPRLRRRPAGRGLQRAQCRLSSSPPASRTRRRCLAQLWARPPDRVHCIRWSTPEGHEQASRAHGTRRSAAQLPDGSPHMRSFNVLFEQPHRPLRREPLPQSLHAPCPSLGGSRVGRDGRRRRSGGCLRPPRPNRAGRPQARAFVEVLGVNDLQPVVGTLAGGTERDRIRRRRRDGRSGPEGSGRRGRDAFA